MKTRLLAAFGALAVALSMIGGVLAAQPPGQRGYEGQPGNQAGQHGNGLLGYEGQPGNQGG